MRPRIRCLAVLSVAFGAVALLILPAQAKGNGEHGSAQGLAVITGPGLDRPIRISGQVDVFEFGVADDFGTLFAGSGLRPYDLNVDGWYDLQQDPATLGPRYEITYTFADPAFSGPIVQDVYPYAPGGRPWFFAHPHQFSPNLFGSRPVPSAWWTAPEWVVALLGRNGLPSTPPVIAPRAPAPAIHPLPAPALAFQPWILGVALTGMLALVLIGIGAGRRAVRVA